MQISTPPRGPCCDTETISSFSSGVYLDWKVSGNLLITITRQAGANAVLNGVFLDSTTPPPTATASFIKQDTTTQGNWIRHLRRAGLRHRLRGPPASLLRHRHPQRPVNLYLDHHLLRPPRLAGPRLDQPHRRRLVLRHQLHRRRQPRPTARPHDLELYFLDWDNKGRGEQVQISDAGTGTVLDTETISSFTSGVYLDWEVSGNLVITITRQAGANAVLNGVFLDAAQVGGAASQLGAGSSVNTGSPSRPIDGRGGNRAGDRAADLRSSPAAGPVDAMLGALPG